DRQRYQPAVVVWNCAEADIYVPRIRALQVPLYTFSPGLSSAAKLRVFRRWVRQLAPEVVHSYTFFTNFAAYWGGKGTPALAVGSIRCDFTFELQSTGLWVGRLSARWPRAQICNSAVAAENVRRGHSPFVPRHLYVVRNGLDLEQFRSTLPPARGP